MFLPMKKPAEALDKLLGQDSSKAIMRIIDSTKLAVVTISNGQEIVKSMADGVAAIDIQRNALLEYLMLFDSGAPNTFLSDFATGDSTPWQTVAPMVRASLCRIITTLLVETGHSKVVSLLLAKAKETIDARDSMNNIQFLADIDWSEALRLVTKRSSSDAPPELISGLPCSDIKVKGTRVELGKAMLVASLAPYATDVVAFHNSVKDMSKALTLQNAVTKLHDVRLANQEAIRLAAAADAESAAKRRKVSGKTPGSAAVPPVIQNPVYRQCFLSQIYDTASLLVQSRNKNVLPIDKKYANVDDINGIVDILDTTVAEDITSVASRFMDDIVKMISVRAQVCKTQPLAGLEQLVIDHLDAAADEDSTANQERKTQVMNITDTKDACELYIAYNIIKKLLSQADGYMPALLELAKSSSPKCTAETIETLTNFYTMATSWKAGSLGEDSPLFLIGRTVGTLTVGVALTRVLQEHETSQQVVVDQATWFCKAILKTLRPSLKDKALTYKAP